MKKLLISAAVLTGLFGCASNDITVNEAQNFAECTFPDAYEIEAPAWICDVMPKDLAAGATGYAKKSISGMAIMRKVAVNDARTALAARFETDVNNLFKQAIESSVSTSTEAGVNEDVQETVENLTKTVVSKTLTNSRLIVSQVSPTGGLYVLVGMDQAAYDNNVAKVVDEVTGEDSVLWKKFNNEKASEDITNALDSLISK
ncbi:LPP20 family lipoprotein [Vibrio sp. F74]|uniref:LPP20 family lipoprotein n=1 Tax=Vibrio sp. F74 TaxID=700020 RepID=UPI0035F57D32